MSLRKTFADTLLGTASQIEGPVISPVKVTRKTVTENNGRKQEITEESRRYSVVGGAIRTFISSIFVRKAISIYKEPPPRTPQTRNESNPPNNAPTDVYDFNNNYLGRT